MAINNDDFAQEVEDAVKDSLSGIKFVIEQHRQGAALTKQQFEQVAKAAGFATEKLKAAASAAEDIANLKDELGSFVLQMGQGTTKFSVLNGLLKTSAELFGSLVSWIPLIGGALKGVSDASAKALTFMTDQFTSAYGAFETLSSQGAAAGDGIETVRRQFTQLGVPIETMASMVKANSQRLAGLSSTTYDAVNQFTMLAGSLKGIQVQADGTIKAVKGMDMELRKLGYSSEEIADVMLQYADIQRLSGNLGMLEISNQEKLKQSTIAYGKELDAIAKLTGQSRKEQQKALDDAMRNARFQAKIRQLEAADKGKEAEAMKSMYLALEKYPQIQKGYADMASGFITTQEAQRLFLSSGGQMAGIVQGLERGTLGYADALGQTQTALKGNIGTVESLSGAIGDAHPFVSLYETTDFTSAALGDLTTAANKARLETEKQAAMQETNTETLSKAKADLEITSSNISNMATSADLAATAIGTFASTLRTVTDKMRELINDFERSDQPDPMVLSGQRRAHQRQAAERAATQVRNEKIAELEAQLANATKLGLTPTQIQSLQQEIKDLREGVDTLGAKFDRAIKQALPTVEGPLSGQVPSRIEQRNSAREQVEERNKDIAPTTPRGRGAAKQKSIKEATDAVKRSLQSGISPDTTLGNQVNSTPLTTDLSVVGPNSGYKSSVTADVSGLTPTETPSNAQQTASNSNTELKGILERQLAALGDISRNTEKTVSTQEKILRHSSA